MIFKIYYEKLKLVFQTRLQYLNEKAELKSQNMQQNIKDLKCTSKSGISISSVSQDTYDLQILSP